MTELTRNLGVSQINKLEQDPSKIILKPLENFFYDGCRPTQPRDLSEDEFQLVMPKTQLKPERPNVDKNNRKHSCDQDYEYEFDGFDEFDELGDIETESVSKSISNSNSKIVEYEKLLHSDSQSNLWRDGVSQPSNLIKKVGHWIYNSHPVQNIYLKNTKKYQGLVQSRYNPTPIWILGSCYSFEGSDKIVIPENLEKYLYYDECFNNSDLNRNSDTERLSQTYKELSDAKNTSNYIYLLRESIQELEEDSKNQGINKKINQNPSHFLQNGNPSQINAENTCEDLDKHNENQSLELIGYAITGSDHELPLHSDKMNDNIDKKLPNRHNSRASQIRDSSIYSDSSDDFFRIDDKAILTKKTKTLRKRLGDSFEEYNKSTTISNPSSKSSYSNTSSFNKRSSGSNLNSSSSPNSSPSVGKTIQGFKSILKLSKVKSLKANSYDNRHKSSEEGHKGKRGEFTKVVNSNFQIKSATTAQQPVATTHCAKKCGPSLQKLKTHYDLDLDKISENLVVNLHNYSNSHDQKIKTRSTPHKQSKLATDSELHSKPPELPAKDRFTDPNSKLIYNGNKQNVDFGRKSNHRSLYKQVAKVVESSFSINEHTKHASHNSDILDSSMVLVKKYDNDHYLNISPVLKSGNPPYQHNQNSTLKSPVSADPQPSIFSNTFKNDILVNRSTTKKVSIPDHYDEKHVIALLDSYERLNRNESPEFLKKYVKTWDVPTFQQSVTVPKVLKWASDQGWLVSTYSYHGWVSCYKKPTCCCLPTSLHHHHKHNQEKGKGINQSTNQYQSQYQDQDQPRDGHKAETPTTPACTWLCLLSWSIYIYIFQNNALPSKTPKIPENNGKDRDNFDGKTPISVVVSAYGQPTAWPKPITETFFSATNLSKKFHQTILNTVVSFQTHFWPQSFGPSPNSKLNNKDCNSDISIYARRRSHDSGSNENTIKQTNLMPTGDKNELNHNHQYQMDSNYMMYIDNNCICEYLDPECEELVKAAKDLVLSAQTKDKNSTAKYPPENFNTFEYVNIQSTINNATVSTLATNKTFEGSLPIKSPNIYKHSNSCSKCNPNSNPSSNNKSKSRRSGRSSVMEKKKEKLMKQLGPELKYVNIDTQNRTGSEDIEDSGEFSPFNSIRTLDTNEKPSTTTFLGNNMSELSIFQPSKVEATVEAEAIRGVESMSSSSEFLDSKLELRKNSNSSSNSNSNSNSKPRPNENLGGTALVNRKTSLNSISSKKCTQWWLQLSRNQHTLLQALYSVKSRFYFHYRKNFGQIGSTFLTSDVGWGCVHRSSQMLLAEAFTRVLPVKSCALASNSSFSTVFPLPHETSKASKHLSSMWHHRILEWFVDKNKEAVSPSFEAAESSGYYSLHSFARAGLLFDKKIGDWFGPNTAANVIKVLVKAHGSEAPLSVHVCTDQAVKSTDVLKLALFEKDSSLPNRISETAASSAIKLEAAALINPQIWNPVLLLVPSRLGVDKINSVYYKKLERLFTLPSFVGFVGGKPGKSFYFIGVQDNSFICLDPHYTKDHKPLPKHNLFKAPSHFKTRSKLTSPTQNLNEEDFENTNTSAKKLLSSHKKHDSGHLLAKDICYKQKYISNDSNKPQKQYQHIFQAQKTQARAKKLASGFVQPINTQFALDKKHSVVRNNSNNAQKFPDIVKNSSIKNSSESDSDDDSDDDDISEYHTANIRFVPFDEADPSALFGFLFKTQEDWNNFLTTECDVNTDGRNTASESCDSLPCSAKTSENQGKNMSKKLGTESELETESGGICKGKTPLFSISH